MADSSVPITAGSGTNIDTRTITGGDHRQVIVIGDPTTDVNVAKVNTSGDQVVSLASPTSLAVGQYAAITALNELAVGITPTAAFGDTFEGTTIDTVRWTTGGTVVPTQVQGNLSLALTATASATSYIGSVPSFIHNTPYLLAGSMVLEAAVVTGGHRFFGFGNSTSNTAAAPLNDGIGWEIDASGQLRASVYNAGTRIFTQTVTTPVDGARHVYAVQCRGDQSWWFKDGFEVAAAQSFIGASSQTLPIRFHNLNGASPSGATTMNISGMVVLDGARTSTGISDGTYQWRKATVSAAGTLASSINSATTGTPATVSSTGTLATHLTNPGLASLGIYAGLAGYGYQRVTTEPGILFVDTFDGAIDTTNRWTAGGTVVPTVSGGSVQIEPGAATSASTSAVSLPTFAPPGGTFLAVGLATKFENVSGTTGSPGYLNSHRFIGLGTIPATWVAAYTASSTSGPMLHAYGYEIDTDGYLYAVVYANGTRLRPDAVGQTVGEKRLNLGRTIFDGNWHQFTMVIRTDAHFWYLDNSDTPCAVLNYKTSGFVIPDIQTLPVRLHTINGTSAPSGTMQFRPAGITVADTGHNSSMMSDGTFPWRRAQITAAGAQVVVPTGNTTSAVSNVTAAAADTSLLASNANRRGATAYNDSTATLYLLLGSGTSSTTNYSVQIAPGGYYEVPFSYSGAIRGIWGAANGAARLTEITA